MEETINELYNKYLEKGLEMEYEEFEADMMNLIEKGKLVGKRPDDRK